MITTRDGFVCKRGDRVWEIGRDISSGLYAPTMSNVHGGKNDVANPNECFREYQNCLEHIAKKAALIYITEQNEQDEQD